MTPVLMPRRSSALSRDLVSIFSSSFSRRREFLTFPRFLELQGRESESLQQLTSSAEGRRAGGVAGSSQRSFFWSRCLKIFSNKAEGEEKGKEKTEKKEGAEWKEEEGKKSQNQPPTMAFVTSDGESKMTCTFRPGQTVLMVAFENGVDIEGACGGQCACSTCHVILNPKDFAKFPEPGEDEKDMLDLAVHTTDTSRLGCQMILKQEHNGLEVRLPEETVNQMYR